MTDSVNGHGRDKPSEDGTRVTNEAPVFGQINADEAHFYGEAPVDHLDLAHQYLRRRQWALAVRSFEEYLKRVHALTAEDWVGFALASLGGKRPRAHTPEDLFAIESCLTTAQEIDVDCAPAAALLAIVNEDLDHVYNRVPDPSSEGFTSVSDGLDLNWAERIATAISVRESRTWRALDARVNPDGDSPTQLLSTLTEEERLDREKRMKILLNPAPKEPAKPEIVNGVPSGLLIVGGACVLLLALSLPRGLGWVWYSPLPYLVFAGAVMMIVGGLRRTGVWHENRHRRLGYEFACAQHREQMARYRVDLPSQVQVETWIERDVQTIMARALDRLGMVLDDLNERGRLIRPLIIVGPADPPRTKIALHPDGGYFASHYSVFVLYMTDRKLGAYRTSLNATTGQREPDEQTSEYRYQDIVSVSVRTNRLDPASDKKGESSGQEADLAYDFVAEQPKSALAERFTLVVPGDRFTVTTMVKNEKDEQRSEIRFSQPDEALAAIRRRILETSMSGRKV
ncbi:hypothetical protein [Planotetraspora mira]|uniref:Uncharacterized protein n=1 Tax=Planotetraspora mira TaxID=58121 RepID=A0A8J3TTT9_9ACTN|nr:hypothetical protein [Planotetraspora mira]GII32306.1 hypothetical protein Pmi06nite_57480 [Planotetraspora mira]